MGSEDGEGGCSERSELCACGKVVAEVYVRLREVPDRRVLNETGDLKGARRTMPQIGCLPARGPSR